MAGLHAARCSLFRRKNLEVMEKILSLENTWKAFPCLGKRYVAGPELLQQQSRCNGSRHRPAGWVGNPGISPRAGRAKERVERCCQRLDVLPRRRGKTRTAAIIIKTRQRWCKQHQEAERLGGRNKGSRLGPWESSPRHHYLFPTSHYAVARPPSRLCPPIRQTRRLQSPCASLHRQSELLSHLFRAASLSDGAAVNQGSIRLLPGLAARRSPALSGSIAWTSAPRWPSSSSVAAAALLPVICL